MILDSVYLGNICPMEDAVSGDKEYHKLREQVISSRNRLEASLSEEQLELAEEFHCALNELNCYEAQAKFRFGFSMGMRIMQEVNLTNQFPKD